MKPVLVILSILLIIACLVFGFYLGNSTTPAATPSTSSLLSSTSTSTDSTGQTSVVNQTSTSTTLNNPNQHNLIFIQADDLSQSHPKLVSIWLVGYLPDSPQLSLILIYPANPNADLTNAKALEANFSFDEHKTLSGSFLSALNAYGFTSDGMILSDETGTSQFVDWLGGISLDNQADKSNGAQVITSLVVPWKDSTGARSSQQKIAQGICLELNQLKPDSNILPLLIDLVPKHFSSNISLDTAVSDWKQVTGQLGDLSCTISLP